MSEDTVSDELRCPACGGRDLVPIRYGLPGSEMREKAARGELELGGCIVSPDNPDRACRSCGERWATRDPGDSERRGEPD